MQDIRSLIATAFRRRPATQDDVLVLGVLILVVSLLAVILFDGYVFYQTFFRPSGMQEISEKQTLTSTDIDAVIKIFDERKARFDKVLRKK